MDRRSSARRASPPAPALEHFGEALALLRRLRGLTQERVAQKARVGRGQLSRYESGYQLPHLKVLGRLLEVLGMTLGDLAGALDTLHRISTQERSQTTILASRTVEGALRELESAHQKLARAVRDEHLGGLRRG